MFKKIYKKLIPALIEKRTKHKSEMCEMEREFLADFENAVLDEIPHG